MRDYCDECDQPIVTRPRNIHGVCLGCDRGVEGENYVQIGDSYHPICPSCQDQLAGAKIAVASALREVLHA